MSNITVIEIGTPEFNELIRSTSEAAAGAARDSFKKMKAEWDWCDEKEAMRLLGCKKSKLQKLRDSGAVLISQPSRKEIHYSVSSIQKYIEKYKVRA